GHVDLAVQVPNSGGGGGGTLAYWNGAGTTTGRIAGGSGTWSAAGTNWTDANGSANGAMAPQPGFAIFEGDAGTVTVDGSHGSIGVTGLQFLTSGYTVQGDAITLGADKTAMRVGAGTASDGDMVATIGSQLVGTGGIEKADAGTLVLSAAESYTGATLIDAGTLALSGDGAIASSSGVTANGTLDISATKAGASIASLAGSGQVVLGGQSLTLVAAKDGFSGVISGTGGLTIASGSEALSGVNSYSGETQIGTTNTMPAERAPSPAGALPRAAAPATTLALTGTGSIAQSSRVVDNGVFDISGTDAGASIKSLSGAGQVALGGQTLTITNAGDAFAGTIAGTGGLALTGGTLTLTGSNSYTGATSISEATLIARTEGALSKASETTVNSGGTLDLGGFNQAVDHVTLNGGTVRNGVVDGLVISTGGTLDGLTGNASIHTSAGTTDVSADSSFGGSVIIDGGQLGLQGSIAGSVAVNATGLLHGNGQMGGLTVASGGIVAPGNSIGTLSVNGDAHFAKGSTYQVQIDPTGAADLIKVSGLAVIDGGTVAVTKAPGTYVPGAHYTILSASGGVDGTFDDLTQDMPFVDLALDYDATHVYLDVARNQASFASVATTRNGAGVAAAAEALGFGNAVYNAVATQSDGAGANQAFNALSGEIHASETSRLQAESGLLRNAVLDQARATGGSGNAVWAQGFGAWGSNQGDGNAVAISGNTSGLLAGITSTIAPDWLGGSWSLGFAGGTSRSTFSNALASQGSSDDYHLAAYGGARFGALTLQAGGAFSWADIATKRTVTFPGFSETLRARYTARTAQAFGEVSYQLPFAKADIAPLAGLAYVNVDTDGLTEEGGASALQGVGRTNAMTYATLGARSAVPVTVANLPVTLSATLKWQHAFGDKTPDALLAFKSGPAQSYTVAGAPIATDSGVAQLGLEVALAKNVSFGLSYDGEIASGAHSNGAHANLTVRF
ncbi:MAG TPA: autotransporter domain-containing protein, partial [Reyranella sp.]